MAYDIPTYADDFTNPNFIVPMESNWPPRAGTPGMWARTYYYGWPWRRDGDRAARSLEANHEAQCYEDSGVAVTPWGLTLTATRNADNHFGLPWTSGCIVQNRDQAMQYGYVEAVMSLPIGRGLWPAFWMLAADMSYPPEHDVLEVLGHEIGRIHCTTHSATEAFNGGTDVTSGDWTQPHKYGFRWTDTDCRWFIDDKPVYMRDTPPEAKRPMFCLFDLGVGGLGSWPGEPADSLQGGVMTIRRFAAHKLGSWGDKLIPSTPPAVNPNGTLESIDFRTGKAVVRGDTGKRFTFDIVSPLPKPLGL